MVRAVRVESYHAVIGIATEVEPWDMASDSKLERLISYMDSTKERGPTWEFHYSDGDSLADIWTEPESDADHGSCVRTGRSLSGWITMLRHGRLSKASVDFGCVRQKVAAIPTAQSEISATKDTWTMSVLAFIGAWEQCLEREIYARPLLDSEAARKAIAKGLSIALRYLRKPSRISLASLHDMAKGLGVASCESADNKSDILTKPMDQQTLTRHLISSEFCALKWMNLGKKREDGNSRTVIAAIQYHLSHAVGEAI